MGLVLSRADYNTILNTTPFMRKVDSGTFTIATPNPRTRSSTTPEVSTITVVAVAKQKSKHEDNGRIYWEYQGVEQALQNQIVTAIDK
mmetsp:Transcript_30148/g.29031  ORF Transcript_30148/g.29031 Transcript_30148/m.29031 type:complete len:88 (+) Transcript_30148:100-363(+)